jgi:hypothetical protein
MVDSAKRRGLRYSVLQPSHASQRGGGVSALPGLKAVELLAVALGFFSTPLLLMPLFVWAHEMYANAFKSASELVRYEELELRIVSLFIQHHANRLSSRSLNHKYCRAR